MSRPAATSHQLELIFNGEFAGPFNTLLVGGAEEPLYQPASGEGQPHRLFYRADYVSSALHETAHWCIAGPGRRRRIDFGYWYVPDGRSLHQQRAFEQVEVKPQALEWIFSTAAGIPFHVSADNLATDNAEAAGPSPAFLHAVEAQATDYCRQGLPERAAEFVAALQAFYRTGDPLQAERYAGGLSS